MWEPAGSELQDRGWGHGRDLFNRYWKSEGGGQLHEIIINKGRVRRGEDFMWNSCSDAEGENRTQQWDRKSMNTPAMPL